MTTEQWARVWDVLDRALDCPPPERRDWLASVCADEPDIRAEVESLLDAYDPDDPLFAAGGEAPAGLTGGEGTEGRAVVQPGMRIGAYRILEEIGMGGMSDVYRAERADETVEQMVALKLMRRQLHAPDAEQRFRAERQVLASLDHPHIAQFVDGGVTEGGRPYLVMEYVEGTPITDYADAHDLDVDARLDLLEQVLHAVQAAHRQLVVHRDLKPSNVLVTDVDGDATVKLLDFGIAKLLDDSLPVTRPQTRTGHRLLTPAYAAPEQMTENDVTTVTDVYQLGVLAYELLSGTRPFALKDNSPSEVERVVTDEMPELPSEKAPAGRTAALRGDLNQIVQTALRKEPERRYASVEALAADLGRYQRGEPVEAQPATFAYRARKFVGRNRVGVSAGITFGLIVAVFIGLLVRQQRITAAERDRAQAQAKKSEQMSSFATSIFELANPQRTGGDTLTVYELLDRGHEGIRRLDDRPAAQAQARYTFGKSYEAVGEYDEAESLLRSSLQQRMRLYGEEPRFELAESQYTLGRFLSEQGRYPEADSLLIEAVQTYRALEGPQVSGRASALDERSRVQWKMENLETADSLVIRALALQRKHQKDSTLQRAQALDRRASILQEQGALPKALEVQRRSLSMCRTAVDPPHPCISDNLSQIELLQEMQREAPEADSL